MKYGTNHSRILLRAIVAMFLICAAMLSPQASAFPSIDHANTMSVSHGDLNMNHGPMVSHDCQGKQASMDKPEQCYCEAACGTALLVQDQSITSRIVKLETTKFSSEPDVDGPQIHPFRPPNS